MSFFRYSAEVSKEVRKKIRIFLILVIFCFLCLWVRVWYLQILKGDYFRELSDNNRVHQVSLPAYRGEIRDRNGKTLVSVRPSFNLYMIPEDIRDLDETLSRLGALIEFDEKALKKKISLSLPFHDVLIKADITREEVARVEENHMRLSGIHIKVQPLRSYAYGDMAAHVLGYLGEISKPELESEGATHYQLGDMVGKNGLENLYETLLRGRKGYKDVEMDVSGRPFRTLRKLSPTSGNNLILTLDLRIQGAVRKVMTGTPENPISGSAIVVDVHSGEILAVTSQPSFDANLFAAGISHEDWKSLLEDERHPLQNRVIDGQYPPGSIYKIVTAFAGLEENVITPESTIYCPGHFRLGKRRYRCWKRAGHGSVDLNQALVQSCDVYFYTVGHLLGVDTIARYAKKLGLGSLTGIRLIGEKPGLIPSTTWKEKAKKEPWLAGETISAAIGQGYNLVTPLQQVNMMAAVANGGVLLKPYLVKRFEDPEGNILEEFFPEVRSQVDFSTQSFDLIRQALRGVVNEPKGTGGRARIKNIVVSGKTGTSQVVGMKVTRSTESEEIPYSFRDHAWFAGFAPYDNPRIAVAVIVEHGGHGGATAAPIAKKIIETYFKYYPLEEFVQGTGEPMEKG